MATTRRDGKGGKDDDRVTGNLIWFGVEHPEGRPAKEDNMPDWDMAPALSCVFNLT